MDLDWIGLLCDGDKDWYSRSLFLIADVIMSFYLSEMRRWELLSEEEKNYINDLRVMGLLIA